MKKEEGFTLIELLAVVVIIGILSVVAVSAVTRIMENARKDMFIGTTKEYANAVQKMWVGDNLHCGSKGTISSDVEPGDYYILIDSKNQDLLEDGGKSSWGNKDMKGYVKVNVSIDAKGNKKTKYYVATTDGIHGVKEVEKKPEELGRKDILLNLKNNDKYFDKSHEMTCVTDGIGTDPSKEDPTPGYLSGSGTMKDPYLIESVEDMLDFVKKVNNKEYSKGSYYIVYDYGRRMHTNFVIKLNSDLDFKSKSSYVDYESTKYGDINKDGKIDTIYNELNSGYGMPIIDPNSDEDFKLIFDGQNHNIKNLNYNVVNSDPNKDVVLSLFGTTDGSFYGTNIMNLNLLNVNIKVDTAGNAYVSPLIREIESYYDYQLANIKVTGNIDAKCGKTCNVGGVFTDLFVYGGPDIVENVDSRVNIKVKSKDAKVGGLSGLGSNFGYAPHNCYYNGNIDVEANNNAYVGGINGFKSANTMVSVNTIANANINVKSRDGEIFGISKLEDAFNSAFYGNITANTYKNVDIAGIGAENAHNCYSIANLTNNIDYRREFTKMIGIAFENVENSYFVGSINYDSKEVYGGGGPYSRNSLLSANNVKNSFVRGKMINKQESKWSTSFGFLTSYIDNYREPVVTNSYYSDDSTYIGNANLYNAGTIVDLSNLKNKDWYKNTLHFDNNWIIESGTYPQLYKCTYNKSKNQCVPTKEKIPHQIKKAVK